MKSGCPVLLASLVLSLVSQLPRRLVLPITALAGSLLLHACSQTAPDASADPALTAGSAPTPTKRTMGTAVDSLDGIPGHTFGEPLRNFPGLVLVTKDEDLGLRVYKMPASRERGWFGKHARDFATYYQFQDGQFALFRAVTTGIDANRTAMREQALFLFGPGKNRTDLLGGWDWEGEQARALYLERITCPVQCWLEVYSKPLLAELQVKKRAQMPVDGALNIP